MMAKDTFQQDVPCPYCGFRSNFHFSYYRRTYFHCPSCDLIFLRRTEATTDMAAYYKNKYFDDCAEDQMEGKRVRLYNHILDHMDKRTKRGPLLDVGCGCGFFLNEAQNRGWEIFGLDPSIKSIQHARHLIGDKALAGTINDLPPHLSFRAVTLINVLDHMTGAWKELAIIRSRLYADGMIYLRFPNGRFHASIVRFFATVAKRPIANPYLVFHEYAFTPQFIKRCLSDLGFLEIRIQNGTLAGNGFYGTECSPVNVAGKAVQCLALAFFRMLDIISGGLWLWGPSLEITARRA